MPVLTEPGRDVKFQRSMMEISNYVRDLRETGDAGIWDCILEARWQLNHERSRPAAVRTVKTPKLPGGDRTEEAEAARWSARIDRELLDN